MIMNLPNLLTTLRLALAPVILFTLHSGAWYGTGVAFLVFGAASVTDFYDGRLARAGNRVTRTGRFLDPLADKVLVTCGLVVLACERLVSLWLVAPIVVRDVIVTGMRVHALARGRQLETSRFARWKTAMQLVAVAVLLFLLAVRDVAARFVPGKGLLLSGGELQLLANLLVAAVLLLTVGSGLQYMMRAQTDGRQLSP